MDSETVVFAVLTALVVLGSVVLLSGVGATGHFNMPVIGAGGAIMVLGILGLAGYVHALPEPEGHESEAGH